MSDSRPHLSLQMKHRLGALDIDAAFELTQPWTVLFGPSGSGKSTVLRAIAGVLRPDSAKIAVRTRVGEQIVTDTASNIFLPAHRRAVRWCAQRAALFPNMTIRENLRFVSPLQGTEGSQAVDAVMEQFHLGPLADRRPAALSGGEQQRAAVARAVCSTSGVHEVGLLLLDEPFSGLDAPLRDGLLKDLRSWLAASRVPVLSVTHDVGEAFLLNAEVVRLQQGRVTQHGPVAEVLAQERLRLLNHLR